jgi:hypothetical protein
MTDGGRGPFPFLFNMLREKTHLRFCPPDKFRKNDHFSAVCPAVRKCPEQTRLLGVRWGCRGCRSLSGCPEVSGSQKTASGNLSAGLRNPMGCASPDNPRLADKSRNRKSHPIETLNPESLRQ